ncbi:MAG: ribonucleoside-diphosphate reductase, adenosylcobalamin-dependent [Parcubacteria group bacterium CG10_big_fil_rev_8_21_14_0_10_36_14]|nr:MAG: ribonucleoside-diphosphate reductase, adenosylcobalamin-dependent [Parcubacteria group bacterium CG10_big_fil_rev_8_21_14_0_10_36_14]
MELQGIHKKVFLDRYAAKDENGNLIEHKPEEMWLRVAKTIAKVEKVDEARQSAEYSFYDAMENFKFIPGGRILSGAGAIGQRTFYNCFVIPSPADSRGGIMESVTRMAEIMARGGGVGVNISTLRPKGSYVKGVNGTASGAVSFGGLYSYVTGLITQGGSRRGALMLMLDVDHPDIEEFITVKRTMGLVTNANLSVCISDSFMKAVKADTDWDLKWKERTYRTVRAKAIWDMICESAWASGEPGVFFMERANKQSNSWYFEELISTNPCGEQPLGAWGVCNLGSINLSNFIKNDEVNWDSLKSTIHKAIHLLDNAIDVTEYFYPENKMAQKNVRRVGLGTMGLADMLIKLKIRYGTEEAIAFCDKLFSFLRDESYRASVELAKIKGSFPKFDAEKYLQGYFIKQLPEDIRAGISQYGIRNAFLLTQAPTGSTGLLANASSGIEPVYDFVTIRKDRLGEHEIMHPLYEKHQAEHPNEERPEYFVTAKELTPSEHIKMQAVIQKYVDSSISKTVNAPNNHTEEDVRQLYIQAYDLGCKGMTYYRDGSRDLAVLYSKEEKKEQEAEAPKISLTPKPRPEVCSGSTYKIKTGYGTLFVTVNDDENGKPFEVFATIGKTGGFFAAKSEAICRLISLALRSGIDVEEVFEQLRGIRGPMPSWSKYGQVLSIPDAIGVILREHINAAQQKLELGFKKPQEKIMTEEKLEELPAAGMEDDVVAELRAVEYSKTEVKIADRGFAPECPECHAILELSEGCMLCRSCGYSKCS